MKKYLIDLRVTRRILLEENYLILHLTDPEKPLPDMRPGQFVEVLVENSPSTFLRRPISINYVDRERNEMWLLVHMIGEGTRAMGRLEPGDTLNCLMPLGNTFSIADEGVQKYKSPLLVGGGVGTAPMLFLGTALAEKGIRPAFLLGGRSRNFLLQLDDFKRIGDLYTTTEDGSHGERGYVTGHSILSEREFDYIATCGPKPMMVAVAAHARKAGISCEVSLENLMACGLGACLCCVEKTVRGNVCVCTEGPVFNTNQLTWHN